MTTLSIRPAMPADAQIATHLIRMTLRRLADFLFGPLNQSTQAKNILAQLFIRPQNIFSYQFTDMAEMNGKIVGLLLSYPGKRMKHLEISTCKQMITICGVVEFIKFLQKALPLFFSCNAKADEYYIANLAALSDFQGKGIGTHLMGYAEGKARTEGLQKCVLDVDIDNHRAHNLYERLGFQVVNTTKFNKLEQLIGYRGEHRMMKTIR